MSAGRVAVALGSGGARGYAHIGVLQVLAERDFEVVTIAGTSMGALVGGVAAAGALAEFADWVTSLTQRQVLRLLDPTLTGGGALRAERVLNQVRIILGDVLIEDCPIPFTAVATDLTNQREVWLQRGPVHTAIRASIAIPTVITPVICDGRLLVDGGLMNPVPLEPTAATLSDLTVAVALSGPRKHPAIDLAPAAVGTRKLPAALSEPLRALTSRITGARDQAAPDEIAEASAQTEGTDLSRDEADAAIRSDLRMRAVGDIVGASLDTMGGVISRYRMAPNPPDVLISIPADACRTMDFHRAAEMIALGRAAAAQALDAFADRSPADPEEESAFR